jgi:hypothetical protein
MPHIMHPMLLRRLAYAIWPLALVVAGLLAGNCAQPEQRTYPNRWFYVSNYLKTDADADSIRALVRTAAAHGLNGMVWAGGLDKLDLAPPEYFRRLQQVKALCDSLRMEVVPCVFSVGYGQAALDHDKNLAAGLPVNGARFVVKDSQAVFIPDPAVFVNNSGFERYQGNKLESFWLQDRPGQVSFVDTTVARSGRASLRFQNIKKAFKGHCRIMQEVDVKPYHLYLVTCWVKTQGLAPLGAFRILPLTRDRRNLSPRNLTVPATTDWIKVQLPFNSLGNNRIRLYVGGWLTQSGKFWIDDLNIREVGLMNVIRRPGAPLQVQNQAGTTLYTEGRDYAPIRDSLPLSENFDCPEPAIRILPGSQIHNQDTILADYYSAIPIERHQITLCMSEPKLYEIWSNQARLMQQYLTPRTYFLDMDEVRTGGWCQTCQSRHLSMAQILGDCITRQCAIIHAASPGAKIYCWSDMLDPNHNAIRNYYLIKGDLTDSWQYVPADLGIVDWNYDKRKKSLRFFSGHGFSTMAAVYYDAGSLESTRKWLHELDRTAGAMYTTWEHDYSNLAQFGDLLKR